MAVSYQDITRKMMDVVEVVQPNPKFLMNFFRNKETEDVEVVELDKQFKGAKVAEFVNPDAVADGREKLNYSNYTFKLPTMQDKVALTSKELKKRLAGEDVYKQKTPAKKGVFLLRGIVKDQKTYVENKMEVMAGQALFESKITVLGKGENREIIFPKDSTLAVDLGSGNYWNESGGTPDIDIEDFIELLANFGGNATHMIGRPNVIRTFIKNDQVAKELDNRRTENGELKFKEMLNVGGAIYYGKYKGIELWGYNGNYKDKDNNSQKIVPDKKIALICADNGNVDLAGYAGDIHIDFAELATNKKAVKDARNYITKYKTGDKSLNVEGIQTRCPMLSDAESVLVATVLA